MIYVMEDVIELIKKYLEEKLPSKLCEISSEYGDTVPLPPIKEWHKAELTAVPAYPVGLILGDRIDPGEQGDYVQSYYMLSIFCLITDTDMERVRVRLYRYIRGIAELLFRNQADIRLNIFLGPAEFSPTYSRTGGYLSDARLVIKVMRYED